jgi:hypothetical protein
VALGGERLGSRALPHTLLNEPAEAQLTTTLVLTPA